ISFLTLSALLAYPIRFVYITLHAPLVLLSYSLIVLTTVVLYLLACDPLPPCVGTVRQWGRSVAAQRVVACEARQRGRSGVTHNSRRMTLARRAFMSLVAAAAAVPRAAWAQAGSKKV